MMMSFGPTIRIALESTGLIPGFSRSRALENFVKKGIWNLIKPILLYFRNLKILVVGETVLLVIFVLGVILQYAEKKVRQQYQGLSEKNWLGLFVPPSQNL